jgi:hypothetical protein
MSTMEVFFTGICSFVKGQTRVLMVDARDARVSAFDPTVAIPAHIPHVRFLLDDLDIDETLARSGKSDPFWFQQLWNGPVEVLGGGTTPTGVVILDHHEMVLPPSSDPLQRDSTALGGPTPGTEDRFSWRWMAQIGEISPGAEEVRADCLTDPPTGPVGAYVRIDNGLLRVRAVPSAYVFDVVNPDGAARDLGRSVAQLTSVMLHPTGNPLSLRAVSYAAPGGDEPSIEATAPPHVRLRDFELVFNKPDVKIFVGISALDDLLQISDPRAGVGNPDYHFELVYDLSANRPSHFSLPRARPIRGSEAREVGFPRCVPPDFGGTP